MDIKLHPDSDPQPTTSIRSAIMFMRITLLLYVIVTSTSIRPDIMSMRINNICNSNTINTCVTILNDWTDIAIIQSKLDLLR